MIGTSSCKGDGRLVRHLARQGTALSGKVAGMRLQVDLAWARKFQKCSKTLVEGEWLCQERRHGDAVVGGEGSLQKCWKTSR